MGTLEKRGIDPEQARFGIINSARNIGELAGEMAMWINHLDWSRRLKAEGVLVNPRLITAFHDVKRTDFLGDEEVIYGAIDTPIPIGFGQTNSQPSTVAQMLEWLDPQPEQRILDVGSGSGWTTALLANVVGFKGQVLGLERIPELVTLGRKNLRKYKYPQAKIRRAGVKLGAPNSGQFDRIIVSAVGEYEWIEELEKQLTGGGKIVMPIYLDENTEMDTRQRRQGIAEIHKRGAVKPEIEIHEGFVFVPLIRGGE